MMYKILGFFSFQPLAEVTGPAEADDSKIIMVNSCAAFGASFHKTPCDKETEVVAYCT